MTVLEMWGKLTPDARRRVLFIQNQPTLDAMLMRCGEQVVRDLLLRELGPLAEPSRVYHYSTPLSDVSGIPTATIRAVAEALNNPVPTCGDVMVAITSGRAVPLDGIPKWLVDLAAQSLQNLPRGTGHYTK